jgi:hypothetical protein
MANVDLDTVLSRGFDAGNYAAAYETTDYDDAIARRSMNRCAAYVAAFTLGFFGSCEPHEMGEHEDTYREALASEHGKRCVELGYVDRAVGDANPCDCGSCHNHNADS